MISQELYYVYICLSNDGCFDVFDSTSIDALLTGHERLTGMFEIRGNELVIVLFWMV